MGDKFVGVSYNQGYVRGVLPFLSCGEASSYPKRVMD